MARCNGTEYKYARLTRPVSGIFVRQQADCLSKSYEVRVLYLDVLQRGATRAPRRYESRERGYVEEIIEVPNRPFLWQFSYLLQLRKAITALRDEFDADIVHCHVAVPAGWGAVMLRAAGLSPKTPIVLTEHSSDVSAWLGRPGLRWMARSRSRHMRAGAALHPVVVVEVPRDCWKYLYRKQYRVPLALIPLADKCLENWWKTRRIEGHTDSNGMNNPLLIAPKVGADGKRTGIRVCIDPHQHRHIPATAHRRRAGCYDQTIFWRIGPQ